VTGAQLHDRVGSGRLLRAAETESDRGRAVGCHDRAAPVGRRVGSDPNELDLGYRLVTATRE